MPTPNPPLLDPEQAALIQGGVAIHLGACCADRQPCAARAIGCRVSRDRRKVTVLVSRIEAATLLAAIGENDLLAVAFSVGAGHRTLQLKGRDARVEAAAAGDTKLVAAYAAALVAKLGELGYVPPQMADLINCPAGELAAISFTPTEASAQRPGPRTAGTLSKVDA